jgi:hypothetical protein
MMAWDSQEERGPEVRVDPMSKPARLPKFELIGDLKIANELDFRPPSARVR